jgi:hypothetical protein
LLTFTSIQHKKTLQRRIDSFLKAIKRIQDRLSEKHFTRRTFINDSQGCRSPPPPRSKLTFQVMGCHLRGDPLLQEIHNQQQRIREVGIEVEELLWVAKGAKGGFSCEQAIELMNVLNRVQGYCEWVCETVGAL